MLQKFRASKSDSITWPNGAIGYRPGGPFDCVGPYARVTNCPVHGAHAYVRVTAFAQSHADTFFSIPAACSFKGHRVSGFFTSDDTGTVFHPHDKHAWLFAPGAEIPTRATRFFHKAAARARAGGVRVDWDSGFSTVSIDWPNSDGAFMQGDEADTFVAEIDGLCKRYPTLNPMVAALALAEPIVECLA